MQAHVIQNGYFWFGYIDDISKCIQKCGKCHVENTLEKMPNKPKVKITNTSCKLSGRYMVFPNYLTNLHLSQ